MTKFLSSLLAISALALSQNLYAQTLQADKTQLSFGATTELAPVTQQLTLTNNQNYPITVTGLKFFNTYGEPAFAVSNGTTLPFTVPAGGSQAVSVVFSPKHNIAHNTELVVETNSHGGNLSVDMIGQGKYSKTYYNNSENKSEEALKTALKTIISTGTTSFSYNVARDKMYEEVDNWKVNGRGSAVNKLECIYTGRIVTGYTNRSDLFSNNNINAEHTFPQGKFGSATPMVSDIHHLFPADENANGSRSSYPFGIADQPYRVDNLNAPSHLGNSLKYEPRDAQKGATARAMLYFVIRYQDYQGFFAPQESILKTWNKTFTPTAVDLKRNADVQARQGNRNPFVDYPQFAYRISNFVSTSTAPNSYDLYNYGQINYGMVSANTTYTYNYILVNNGNQTMNFTNPALSNPAILSFASGSGSNFSVAPGEAYTLKVNLNLATTDSIAETLTLASNIPNQGSLSIPIYANKTKVQNPLTTGKDVEALKFDVYPNPVADEFVVARGDNFGAGLYQIQVTDALGKQVKLVKSTTNQTSVNIENLKRGIYFVHIAEGNRMLTKKIVKL